MASQNLIEVAELFWRKMFPNPSDDELGIKRAEIIAAAKIEYGFLQFQMAQTMRHEEGEFTIPAAMILTAPVTVADKKADITDLLIINAIPMERWAIGLRGKKTGINYIKSSAASVQKIDADDLAAPRYYVMGESIIFPDEVDDAECEFTYAGMPDSDEYIGISGEMGSLIDRALSQRYGFRQPEKEDKTVNSNPDF